MALLILIAAMWIVVLAPGLLRRRSERKSVGSIDHFHHQLHLLERSGPKLVAPAYRLQSVESATGMAVGSSGFPAVTSMPGRPNLVLLKPVDHDDVDPAEVVDDGAGGHYQRIGPPEMPSTPAPSVIRLADPDRYRRQQQAKRRRDVLGLTLGTTVVTGLLGIVPSLHILWVATVLGGMALATYVGLMVYAQRLLGSRPQVARPTHATSPAQAGYPGGWDTDATSYQDFEYHEPMRAAGGR